MDKSKGLILIIDLDHLGAFIEARISFLQVGFLSQGLFW